MVVDVVLSRQRLYQDRVLPVVARWEADSKAHSLPWLATHELDQKRYGLRTGESATIAGPARNMVAEQPLVRPDRVQTPARGAQPVERCFVPPRVLLPGGEKCVMCSTGSSERDFASRIGSRSPIWSSKYTATSS